MSSSLQAERLVTLLRQHGVDHQSAPGLAAWSAFKDFGREMFGARGIGLLFQVGTYDFTGKPLFYFDPVCQFEITDPDGEHDHFEQLHCGLTCVPDDAVNGVEASLWSFATQRQMRSLQLWKLCLLSKQLSGGWIMILLLAMRPSSTPSNNSFKPNPLRGSA